MAFDRCSIKDYLLTYLPYRYWQCNSKGYHEIYSNIPQNASGKADRPCCNLRLQGSVGWNVDNMLHATNDDHKLPLFSFLTSAPRLGTVCAAVRRSLTRRCQGSRQSEQSSLSSEAVCDDQRVHGQTMLLCRPSTFSDYQHTTQAFTNNQPHHVC